MLVRPLTRPIVSPLADPLRENALPWDEGVRGGGALSTPTILGGALTIWNDQRDLVDVGGTAYSDWGNQAQASGDFTQTTPSARPATGRTIAGYAAPDFDGTDDFMTTTAFPLSSCVSASAYHVFVVYLADAIATNSFGFNNAGLVCDAGGFFWTSLRNIAGTLTATCGHWDGAEKTISASGVATGSAQLLEFWFTGGTQRARVAAGATASGAAGNITTLTNQVRIGRNFAGASSSHNGLIASVLMCNRALTAGEQTIIRAYLAARYGVTV